MNKNRIVLVIFLIFLQLSALYFLDMFFTNGELIAKYLSKILPQNIWYAGALIFGILGVIFIRNDWLQIKEKIEKEEK